MIEYDIPESIADLFSEVPATYAIEDESQPGNNISSMNLFLQAMGIPRHMIVEDSGTQVIIQDKGRGYAMIDAYGGGDLCSHRFDVQRHYPGDISTELVEEAALRVEVHSQCGALACVDVIWGKGQFTALTSLQQRIGVFRAKSWLEAGVNPVDIERFILNLN